MRTDRHSGLIPGGGGGGYTRIKSLVYTTPDTLPRYSTSIPLSSWYTLPSSPGYALWTGWMCDLRHFT